MKSLALTIRFLLELAMLVAFVVGVHALIGGAIGWVAGVVVATLGITAWAIWIAPKAPHRPSQPIRIALEALLFGAAAAALIAGGLLLWGLVLIVIWALDIGAIVAFGITEDDFFVKPTD
jgi:hypothetical protein